MDGRPFDQVWWRDPWWEDPVYQEEYSLTLAQIRSLVEALKGLFNEDWMRRALAAPPPNAILSILRGGQGLWPFQNMMWLGRVATSLGTIPSIHRPLRDLIGRKSRSTLFEMETAAWLAESAWELEFPKPAAGKTPDLRVSKGDIQTAVECKYFHAEQWENWVDDLSLELIRLWSREKLNELPSHEIVFEPRLPDIVWQDEATRKTIQRGIAERLCEAIKEAFQTDPPRSIRIHGIGVVRVRPDLPNSQRTIGGIQVSPQAKTRRIITNGVLEAAEQLRGYGPGAIAINAHFAPPEALLDLALQAINRANPSTLATVAVVVVVGYAGSPAVIWQNPETPGQHSEMLVETFRSALLSPQRLIRAGQP